MAVIAKAHDAKEITHADSLVDQLRNLITEAQSIADEAKRTKKLAVAMAGIDKQARVLELIARLTGQLDEGARVNVAVIQQQQREHPDD